MNLSKQVTKAINSLHAPIASLILFGRETGLDDPEYYAEHYDFDELGFPINAHPPTLRETDRILKALDTSTGKKSQFLLPQGVLPESVLHIRTNGEGRVIWHTTAQPRHLHFVQSLGIPSGIATVPPMLWCATRTTLRVFALKTKQRPDGSTPVFYAPFFNLYRNGRVCLGNVPVDIKSSATLEEFMEAWQRYFFSSYFSHALGCSRFTTAELCNQWSQLINTQTPFPLTKLVNAGITLTDLIN